jgi:hypothetical protein
MSLVNDVLALAENGYCLDWAQIAEEVNHSVPPGIRYEPALFAPRTQPLAWCVPTLIGDYLGASAPAVAADTSAFLLGCVIRQHLFHSSEPCRPSETTAKLLMSAYEGCRRDAPVDGFADRFAAKSRPWTVLLGLGTANLKGDVRAADYRRVMATIVTVYSSLQIVDDWHDRAEDAGRDHWNMWVDEPRDTVLTIIEPLLTQGRTSVQQLRSHLLRRALDAQLADTAADLLTISRSGATAR